MGLGLAGGGRHVIHVGTDKECGEDGAMHAWASEREVVVHTCAILWLLASGAHVMCACPGCLCERRCTKCTLTKNLLTQHALADHNGVIVRVSGGEV